MLYMIEKYSIAVKNGTMLIDAKEGLNLPIVPVRYRKLVKAYMEEHGEISRGDIECKNILT